VLWLIETNIASAGKPHLGNGTPSCVLNFRELNALTRERSHLGFQIVAHEIEFVGALLGGVNRGRRKCLYVRIENICFGLPLPVLLFTDHYIFPRDGQKLPLA
jgi:hypothetical protein